MTTSHKYCALLMWSALWSVAGCGTRSGEQWADANLCEPGETRECVGPGACRGGQICGRDWHWDGCECSNGNAAQSGATAKGGSATASGGTFSTAQGGSFATGRGGTTWTTSTGTAKGGSSSSSTRTGTGGVGTGSASMGGVSVKTAQAGSPITSSGGPGAGRTGYAGKPTSGGSSNASGGGSGGSSGRSGVPAGAGGIAGTPSVGGLSATGGSTPVNHPPVISLVSFYSTAPQTNDWLWVNVEATDADNDSINYDYAWTRNGIAVGPNSSYLDGGSYFGKGDELRVTVTPKDGKSAGQAVTSSPVVVKNSPPYAYTPSIEPDSMADDGKPLKCVPSSSDSDADLDPLTITTHWFLNGQPYAGTSDTIASAVTAVGQKWSCSNTVSDGVDSSDSDLSTVTQIATQASGIIRTNVTWTAANSPYFIRDRVQIAAGALLTVEPGVRIIGNSSAIESWGSVSMLGTADKPILAQSVYFSDRSTVDAPGAVKLSYVQFSGAINSDGSATSFQVTHSIIGLEGQMSVNLNGALGTAPHDFEYNVFRSCSSISSLGTLTLLNNVFTCDYPYAGYTQVYAQLSVLANYNSFFAFDAATPSVSVGASTADLRNNYWGGVADSAVPDRIYDNNDDLNIAAVATYLPTLSAPHANTPPTNLTYFSQ